MSYPGRAQTVVSSAKPRRRRWSFAGLVFVATLVLVELSLQGAALVLHLATRNVLPPITSGDVVLCVGDSWTQGMGSSDQTRFSYPAVLEDLLRKQSGRPWQVVNAGLSGQNSRDVLLRLPSQLADVKPRIVCVLIGRNDHWTRPVEVEAAVAFHHSAFLFRWRIPRLIAWAWGGAFGERPAPPAVRGPEWKARDIPWRSAYPHEPALQEYDKAVAARTTAGWAKEGAKDFKGAVAEFEAARRAQPDNQEARQGLVVANARLGEMAAALEHLEWLQAKWATTHNFWVGRALSSALQAVGRDAEAVALLREFLVRWPNEATGWFVLASCEFQLGDLASANASIERAMLGFPSQVTSMVRMKIRQALRDPIGAVDAVLDGYVHTNDEPWATKWFHGILERSEFDPQTLLARVAALQCPDDVRARLVVIVQDCLAAQDGKAAERVLRAHLRNIAGHCQTAGAQAVFLTYPVRTPFGRTMIAAAAELGLPAIDVEAVLAAKLGAERLRELTSPDGHVVDEGYRLMATVVAEGLRDLAIQAK